MSEHRDHFGISPKTEREWEPKGSLDFEIPQEPSAEGKAPNMKPSEEKLTTPDRRAFTVLDRGRSFGFSLALHLALGAAWLSIPDRRTDAKEPDPTHLRGERQIEALGDTVRARILRAAETDERNREVLERLQKERHDYYDRAIEAFLNPESHEYERRLGIPPIEAFAQIDAMLKAEERAKSVTTEKLDEEHVHQLVREYKENLLTRHRENMALLLKQDYTWTGDVRRDFPTLQKALFQGPDRYFYNPGLPDTKYQKDHDRFDEHLETGIVNCQVARMTPMVLAEIYEQRGLPKEDLRNMRTVVWQDHVFSGYENPQTQETFTLMEGSFGTPEWAGTHPPSAEDPGRLLPAGKHLASYILGHDPTDRHREKIAELGYDYAALGTFSSEPLPTETVDFGTYEKIVAGDKTAAEVLLQGSEAERESEPTESAQETLESAIFTSLTDYFSYTTQTDPPYGALITLPPWVRSEAVREHIRRRGLAISSQNHVVRDVHRTLLMDGEHSRELLEQTLDQAYENAQQDLELFYKNYERTSPGDMAEFLLISNGRSPLGTKVIYRFKDEPWFDPALEYLLRRRVEGVRKAVEGSDDLSHIESEPRAAQDTIQFFERLAQEYEREYGTEKRNPFRRKAQRLEEALIPYKDAVGVDAFSREQILALSEDEFARAFHNNPDFILHPTSITLGFEGADRQHAALERLTDYPDLYMKVFRQALEERVSQFNLNFLSPHVRYAGRALQKHPELLPHLRPVIKTALLNILERDVRSGNDSPNASHRAIGKLLSFHEQQPWLRPVIEETLQETHAKRPFTDFDIYYAGLERFGIAPSFPLNTMRPDLVVQTLRASDSPGYSFCVTQFHDRHNPEFDALFLQAYLDEPDQIVRLYLLNAFYDRTRLAPPVSTDQLFPEDLAVIEATPDTVRREPGVTITGSRSVFASDLKPFYAPETIDITRELRLNPRFPDFQMYLNWEERNPELGLQYVEQWMAFQNEQQEQQNVPPSSEPRIHFGRHPQTPSPGLQESFDEILPESQ